MIDDIWPVNALASSYLQLIRVWHFRYSTTAHHNTLDWVPVFEAANLPIFEKLYWSRRFGAW
jgi:hypothetical protein